MPHKPIAYRRPKPLEVIEGQLGLFDAAVDRPDPKAEAERGKALKESLARWEHQARKQIAAIDIVRRLAERGMQTPDIAAALGLPPIIERKSRPLNPWRIRPGTNIAIIADLLEARGTKGASEAEMAAELRRHGRLENARNPNRAVHWTASELQRRTRFCYRGPVARGGRWYAYGPFTTWRSAQKSKVAKLGSVGDGMVQLHTRADFGRSK